MFSYFTTFSTKTPPCFVDRRRDDCSPTSSFLSQNHPLRLTKASREKEARTRFRAEAQLLRQAHALTHGNAHSTAPFASEALRRARPVWTLRTLDFGHKQMKRWMGRQKPQKNAGRILGKGQRRGASSSFLPDTLENIIWVWHSYCQKNHPKVHFAQAVTEAWQFREPGTKNPGGHRPPSSRRLRGRGAARAARFPALPSAARARARPLSVTCSGAAPARSGSRSESGNPPLRPTPCGPLRAERRGCGKHKGWGSGQNPRGRDGGYRVEVEHRCHQRQQEGNGEDREVQHGSSAREPRLGSRARGAAPQPGQFCGMGVWAEAPGGPASQWAAGGGAGTGGAGGESNGAPRAGGEAGDAPQGGGDGRRGITARPRALGSEPQGKAESGLLKHVSGYHRSARTNTFPVDLRLKPVNQGRLGASAG